ncbi:hypothetical protein MPTK1_6g09460 [Marchantia polymorpha subsp. ruderalis]|uniref:Uncharacterized protein n=2 Tax=Marchantia polymorpha TaxID=3197 RepID=A0AAF6BQ86_MARPO|nr:hypothetical protein MARPO_0152s0010 [Marchantia polymorpha]BBN14170.1 hypothetical protein Mp_6g09460 [Marchantia polymorpha subsp. ruderalis]|eukprot:PTQ28894.1 hypothetical protein MARPO_0152s0010 [Marchantia polymorpha]
MLDTRSLFHTGIAVHCTLGLVSTFFHIEAFSFLFTITSCLHYMYMIGLAFDLHAPYRCLHIILSIKVLCSLRYFLYVPQASVNLCWAFSHIQCFVY